jgi:predicted component of type VI protein secretion system
VHRTLLLSCGLLAGFLSTGCGAKLNDERTVEVSPDREVNVAVDPFKREQKINVSVKTTGGPVDVFVYLKQDEKDAQDAIYAKKKDKVLAEARSVEDHNLEATVPANSAAVVMLSSRAKKVTVKLKITN